MRSLLSLMVGSLIVLNLGCTRNVLGQKVSLTIPLGGDSSSLSGVDPMRYAVVNIQIPGRLPIVKEFDFDDNPNSSGSTVLTVEGVPTGTMLIQFLGVFDSAVGSAYIIKYGDLLANIQTGSNNITINATDVPGSPSSKEGRVAGRFFDSPTNGPTGTLVSFYYPPNGKPKMAVSKSSILGGWFNTLVLDNIPMSVEVLESGITIFAGLKIDDPALATGMHVLKMNSAPYYRKEQRNGGVVTIRSQIAGSLYLGYFKNANGPASFSPYRACYMSGKTEGLKGWYGSLSGSTFSNPLIYSSASVPFAGLTVVGGGYPIDYTNFYNGVGCDATGSDMIFYAHRTAEGHDSFSGFKAPFLVVDPFATYGGFLRASYSATGPSVNLHWKYLPGMAPGITGSPLDGIDILYKNEGNNSSSSGKDTCEDYINKGYTVVGTIDTSLDSYTFSGHGLTANNYYGYRFALCGSKGLGTAKKYVGEIVTSDCVGGCNNGLEGFGWGTGNLTISTPNTADMALGVHFGVVRSSDAISSDLYTAITISGGVTPNQFTTTDIGDEVMLNVVGMGTDGDCGQYQGMDIRVGQRAFSRLLYASSNLIKIAKGTFADSISETNLSGLASTSNFCFVQATRIPHFRNLTLAANVDANGFTYNDGGGIVPFRVSELLTITGNVTIGATGRGFSSGASLAGEGHRKAASVTPAAGNSGGSYSSGYGAGGAGPNAQGGQATNGGGSFVETGGASPMGNSGGGGYIDPLVMLGGAGGGSGGNGGGSIFAVARYMSGGVGAEFNVGAGASGGSSYGGGGGGSVVLMADQVSGTIHVEARGGSTGAGPSMGGAGGGGTVTQIFCTPSFVTTAVVLGGTGPGAANTASGAFDGKLTTVLKPDPAQTDVNSPNYSGNYNQACQY